MKNDIKKKFIDILFEPDDDEDEGYEIPQPKKPVPKQESTVSAKDLLYKKSGQSAFINLDEKKTKKESSEPETEYGDYEFTDLRLRQQRGLREGSFRFEPDDGQYR